jgi:hypothetical protein
MFTFKLAAVGLFLVVATFMWLPPALHAAVTAALVLLVLVVSIARRWIHDRKPSVGPPVPHAAAGSASGSTPSVQPPAELLRVLMLPDFDRVDRIGRYWGTRRREPSPSS